MKSQLAILVGFWATTAAHAALAERRLSPPSTWVSTRNWTDNSARHQTRRRARRSGLLARLDRQADPADPELLPLRWPVHAAAQWRGRNAAEIDQIPGKDLPSPDCQFRSARRCRAGRPQEGELHQAARSRLPADGMAISHRAICLDQATGQRGWLQVCQIRRRLCSPGRRHGAIGTGMVTRYLYGVTFLPFDVKMAVTRLRRVAAPPSPALKFCFNYDPAGRRYSLASRGSPRLHNSAGRRLRRCGGRHAQRRRKSDPRSPREHRR